MTEIRDIAEDYRKAYLAEYRSYLAAGLTERAAAVAETLRAMGFEVAGVRERAVPTETLETAVESDTPPKRRGRPAKTADK